MTKKELRVAYLVDKPIGSLQVDPAKIELVKQANLVRALYGRLVEFTQNGSVTPSLAESLDISNDLVTFKIRAKMFTKNKKNITAKDAAFSLKRLLVLKSNLHASLEQFLCGNELKNIQDACSGISWKDNVLTLKLLDPKFSQFLIPLLANVDFSIIPYESIDWNDPKLPIINYADTSGAYYVEADYSDNQIILRKNPTNPCLQEESADRIVLVKAGFDDASKLFLENKVDFIPTIYQFSEEFIKQSSNIRSDLHESLPIRIWFAKFYQNKNLTEFSESELKYIAKILKNNLPSTAFDFGFKPADKLFPNLSEACLTEQQDLNLQEFWLNTNEKTPKNKFRIWAPITKLNILQETFKKFPFIEFYYDKVAPWNLAEKDRPNALIIAMDSTFFEDLSVINYNFSMGFFGYSKADSQQWIQKYVRTADKSERIKLLRDLHYSLLTNLEIVPLGFTPYIAVSRNGWKINFSRYYAGSPLWSVIHN